MCNYIILKKKYKLQMPTILITGGSGFVGSNLCRYLIKDLENKIICIDNNFTSDHDNISELTQFKNFVFYKHDIINKITFLEDEKIDQIYHLACPASPPAYQKDPYYTVQISTIGTFNIVEFALKKKARLLFTSTSEVYGDPLIHPQKESYWGNVNPIGIRSCYDEGKRVSEAIMYAAFRSRNLNMCIVRIFNSLTGDQLVLYKDELGRLQYKSFEDCWKETKNPNKLMVPVFDNDGNSKWGRVSHIHRHKVFKKGFRIKTTWNKSVKLTEDHGIFTLNVKNNSPVPIFASELKIGDRIAVPTVINLGEKPLKEFYLSEALYDENYNVLGDNVLDYLKKNEDTNKNSASCGYAYSIRHNKIKTKLLQKQDTKYFKYIMAPFSNKKLKNKIKKKNLNKLLWILGLYLAEGCLVYSDHERMITFTSNLKYLQKAKGYIKDIFDIEPLLVPPKDNRAPCLKVMSIIIVELFHKYFKFNKKLSTKKDVPNWILELPKNQIIHFIHGFWEGDGNHDSKTTGKKIIINSSSKNIINKFNLIFAKFGIIPSISEFYTKVSKESDKKFKSYRITIQGLSGYDILKLETIYQTHQRIKTNDISWAIVKEIEEFQIDDYVYDFSVPKYENFVGGDYMIYCHNTYGPYMHPKDGRVISNFINQAIEGNNITVYGDGSQTRSICYIDDLLKGLYSLMNSTEIGPINIGNPSEYTILELALLIKKLTQSNSEIIFEKLPSDDPLQRKPDISLAKEKLGWEPVINPEEGLYNTIKYFKSLRKLE